MSRYRTDSLFADVNSRPRSESRTGLRGNDIKKRGNDKEAACSHIIRVAFESGALNSFEFLVLSFEL